MPRRSIADVVEQRLDEEGGYLDLRIDVMRCMCPRCARPGRRPEHFLTAGGRWDRDAKAYIGPGETSRRIYVQDAQLDATRFFAGWLAARRRGEHVLGPDGTPCFTMGVVGGRRSGKTDLSPKLPVAYLLAVPRSIAWIVIPGYPDMPELERALEDMVPPAWYEATGGGREEALVATFANGSELEIISSRDTEALKRGRADVVVIHEAQKQDEDTYATVAPAIADRGGLVIIAANPPKRARGFWVDDFVQRARAKQTDEVVFELDPRLNPHVNHAALDAVKKRVDERTFRREILGEFLPRTDVVMYAFSPSPLHGNVRELGRGDSGERLVEVTGKFLARRLGGEPDKNLRAHGVDLQLWPHMASASARFFEDPLEPDVPFLFFTHGLLVEQATEDELLDALERQVDDLGAFSGADAAVLDASGFWQDSERTKGRASADIFRRRGWRRLYKPDDRSDRNPLIDERLKVMNALWCNAAKRRKAFVVPEAVPLITAMKKWENRNGVPNRRSEYAHIADAASYLAYRLYPRRAPTAPNRVTLIERPKVRTFESL